MTGTNQKTRLFLTALMIGSVFITTIAFSGAVTAADTNRGSTNQSNDWSTSDGSGNVGDGAVIYRGEDIRLVDEDGSTPDPESFERTAGPDEGVPLQVPVPDDQPTGAYESQTDDFTLIVRRPRVTTLEVLNDNGNDVAGETLRADQDQAAVNVEYNYGNAEDIAVIVENENGLDVTDEIVDDSATRNGDGEIGLDPGTVDEGEYTFTVEGVRDLDTADAIESVAVTITAQETAPTAAFEYAPDRPSVDDPVRFDASESFDPDGEIVRYSWDFDGDGSVDQQLGTSSRSHTYDEPGEYLVVLEVVDDDGAVGQTERTILVTEPPTETNEPPTTAFEYAPDRPSVDDPVRFDASESFDPDGEIVRYSWDFDGDGSIDQQSSAPSASYTYDEPGEYTVVLEVVDQDGTVSQTQTTTRVVEPLLPFEGADLVLGGTGGIVGLLTARRARRRFDDTDGQEEEEHGTPEAKISYAPEEPAIGRPVLFDGSASVAPGPDNRIVNYRWTVDEREPTAPRFVHVFLETGDHDVELKVVDNRGSIGTRTETITVQTEDGELELDRIRPDAPGYDHENLDQEYLIFENAGDGPLELDGWTVHDAAEEEDRVTEGEHTFVFPDGFELDPGATVTVHTGTEPEDAAGREERDEERHLFWDKNWAVWNNDSDIVVVEDDREHPVIAIRYERIDGGEYELEKLDVEILEEWFPDVVVSSRDEAPLLNIRFDSKTGLAALSSLSGLVAGAGFLRGPKAFLSSWTDITGFLAMFLVTWVASTSTGVVSQSIEMAVPLLLFAGAVGMLVIGGVARLAQYTISSLSGRAT